MRERDIQFTIAVTFKCIKDMLFTITVTIPRTGSLAMPEARSASWRVRNFESMWTRKYGFMSCITVTFAVIKELFSLL